MAPETISLINVTKLSYSYKCMTVSINPTNFMKLFVTRSIPEWNKLPVTEVESIITLNGILQVHQLIPSIGRELVLPITRK